MEWLGSGHWLPAGLCLTNLSHEGVEAASVFDEHLLDVPYVSVRYAAAYSGVANVEHVFFSVWSEFLDLAHCLSDIAESFDLAQQQLVCLGLIEVIQKCIHVLDGVELGAGVVLVVPDEALKFTGYTIDAVSIAPVDGAGFGCVANCEEEVDIGV